MMFGPVRMAELTTGILLRRAAATSVASRNSPRAKRVGDVVGRQTGDISEGEHIGEGDRHPFPASGLATNDGERGSALRGKAVPGQQRQRGGEAPFGGKHLSDLGGGL